MAPQATRPRVLIVTPEVTYLPDRMGPLCHYLTAKAGGLADVSAALIQALFDQGADVHVALPDYRAIFSDRLTPFMAKEQRLLRRIMPDDRLHLAEDRAFFYINQVYSAYGGENIKLALAFQREVINNIIPRVAPDLIHCNDWMTGLIPAVARRLGIPCLFTIHNIHTVSATLEQIEDRGVDAAAFWEHLYYRRQPHSYEETRVTNPVDFLASGVFAAHFVNTVSTTFLEEIVQGRHAFIEPPLRHELSNKWHAGCAVGILNAPDPAFAPEEDPYLFRPYGSGDVMAGKAANKRAFQERLGLVVDPEAPMFFWPSRLDPHQKGCQLLAEILFTVISRYWERNLQVIFVADGPYQGVFREIVNHHGFHQRVAICDFNEEQEHRGYGSADFVLMPSLFEPCGLPQMIGCRYGCLPVVHDTGGLHDTVSHLDVEHGRGNGFLFETHDPGGLLWAMDEAMAFHVRPAELRRQTIQRVMRDAQARFTHEVNAREYMALYERMLQRPLLV